jgi:hypothetical protein
VEAHIGEHVIQLFFRQELVATHVRSRVRGGHTTVQEHMPPQHRFVEEVLRNRRDGPGWVLGQAREVGPHTEEFVERLMQARAFPEQGIRSGLGVLSLARKHPREWMERACVLLSKEDSPSYRMLRTLLERWKRTPPSVEESPASLPPHANLRGQLSFIPKGE